MQFRLSTFPVLNILMLCFTIKLPETEGRFCLPDPLLASRPLQITAFSYVIPLLSFSLPLSMYFSTSRVSIRNNVLRILFTDLRKLISLYIIIFSSFGLNSPFILKHHNGKYLQVT